MVVSLTQLCVRFGHLISHLQNLSEEPFVPLGTSSWCDNVPACNNTEGGIRIFVFGEGATFRLLIKTKKALFIQIIHLNTFLWQILELAGFRKMMQLFVFWPLTQMCFLCCYIPFVWLSQLGHKQGGAVWKHQAHVIKGEVPPKETFCMWFNIKKQIWILTFFDMGSCGRRIIWFKNPFERCEVQFVIMLYCFMTGISILSIRGTRTKSTTTH